MKTIKMHLLLIKLSLTWITHQTMRTYDIVRNQGRNVAHLDESYKLEVEDYDRRCEEIAIGR